MFGFLLLLLVGILGLSSDRQAWIQWKMRHGKTYTSLQEERDHMAVWLENNMFVAEHNSRRDVSFKVALNALADKVPFIESSICNTCVVPDFQLPGISRYV